MAERRAVLREFWPPLDGVRRQFVFANFTLQFSLPRLCPCVSLRGSFVSNLALTSYFDGCLGVAAISYFPPLRLVLLLVLILWLFDTRLPP